MCDTNALTAELYVLMVLVAAGNFSIKLTRAMNVNAGILTTFKEIFQTAFISLAIFLFIYVFLVQPHRVKGESMSPTFEDGELLLTEKLSYRFNEVKRGDVVVFEAPIGRKVDFIKRIIGLPGDDLTVKDGTVTVNGQKLSEPYISSPTQGEEQRTLGPDEYFVFGDNRGASSDSRVFGPIKKSAVRGRVFLVYWPIIKTQDLGGLRLVGSTHY